jgi:uncharacterized protein with NRDE domain
MCTLVLLRDLHPDWPLVVAANRDEFFARPTAAPHFLSDRPAIFGGRDLKAGGTWLGVTPSGFFVGITNQRLTSMPKEAPRSRGELVLEALRQGDSTSAQAWLLRQDPKEFNPFNLIYGDCAEVTVAYGRSDWRFESVPAGISVLPNDELNSPDFPKVERAQSLCEQLPLDKRDFLKGLEMMLSDRMSPETQPVADSPLGVEFQRSLHALCVATPHYGTRSSTIIALQPGRVDRYLHAEGPPTETEFVDHWFPEGKRS